MFCQDKINFSWSSEVRGEHDKLGETRVFTNKLIQPCAPVAPPSQSFAGTLGKSLHLDFCSPTPAPLAPSIRTLD